MEITGDRPPRYDKKTPLFHVGRWENLSLASVLLADRITAVGQEHLSLSRFTGVEGDLKLQRWAQCLFLSVFAHPPKGNKYRNGFMKHPRLINE